MATEELFKAKLIPISKILEVREDRLNEIIDNVYEVGGWVRTCRIQSKLSFIHINDGSCFGNLQIIPTDAVDTTKCKTGCYIVVKGKLVKSPARGQLVEIIAETLSVTGGVRDTDFPFTKKKFGLPYIRLHPQFKARTNFSNSIMRVRSSLIMAIHQFYQDRGFYNMHTPLITTSDCEGGGEAFTITNIMKKKISDIPAVKVDGVEYTDFSKDIFEEQTHLTVSGQLHVEAFAMGLGKVYTFGPAFRAEGSRSYKHVSELWMIEPELVDVDLIQLMNLAEDSIKYCIKYILERYPDEMKYFSSKYMYSGKQEPFERVSYDEAIIMIHNDEKSGTKFEKHIEYGEDLNAEHEKHLVSKFDRPVFIHTYPKGIKAFYMKRSTDINKVDCFDLLTPDVGELIGGSMRESDYDILMEKMEEMGIDPKPLEFYTDLRKYGCPEHGGFGIGLERLVMFITGAKHIKDVLPFPRCSGHIMA